MNKCLPNVLWVNTKKLRLPKNNRSSTKVHPIDTKISTPTFPSVSPVVTKLVSPTLRVKKSPTASASTSIDVLMPIEKLLTPTFLRKDYDKYKTISTDSNFLHGLFIDFMNHALNNFLNILSNAVNFSRSETTKLVLNKLIENVPASGTFESIWEKSGKNFNKAVLAVKNSILVGLDGRELKTVYSLATRAIERSSASFSSLSPSSKCSISPTSSTTNEAEECVRRILNFRV